MSKRKSLTIEEKANIIWRLQEGESNTMLSKEFGVSHSTISTVWANKEKIRRCFEEESFLVKKVRRTQHTDLDKALLQWFKQHREKNVPINGPILLTKAREFSAMLNKDFQPDPSWVQRFRNRHNIVFAKMSGESADVPAGVKDHWLGNVWPKIREGYVDEEIFNCDETGLFYKLTPDKTFKFLGEKCSGGKHSKDRVTVLVAANLTGSVKKKLVVIGKSKNSRCFKNVKNLPVQYEHNIRSWMTSQLFEKLLREWDGELRRENKKILLLVDNCPAHPHVASLKCIKLVFLPANTTSVLQPMDQGVIKALKVNFRKLLVLKMIDNIEKNIEHNVHLLQAIVMVSKAWDIVDCDTIRNCFRHGGFLSSDNSESNSTSKIWRIGQKILIYLPKWG
ncbi:tigger transposable element-derived protein 4-like [Diorhabda sublineata]|uniref:tigger transposable element-derived protein 4-like n=1 Tax=Diorhabda sublineata TaxID=1163346 RepID=UPI0024E075BA|nr:tigger transposable element-derived protein 4-like [Diorhabda sublineata]